MKDKVDVILYLIVIAVIVSFVVMTVNSCDGTIVRGLFWFECIGVGDE